MLNIINGWSTLGQLGLLAAAAGLISATLAVGLRPLFISYTLARPNARSSHHKPTPQGGGIAVIGATAIVVVAAIVGTPDLNDQFRLSIVLSSIIGLAVVGAVDDMRPIEAFPRLLLQTLAVTIVVCVLPIDLRVLPIAPWWIERVLLIVGVIWFVNLVNFMDGIDWMTVAEVVPITGGLAIAAFLSALPITGLVAATVLFGATIGFAPFNRPVARLFLGDVGSLPIGLLLGWLLVLLAGGGHFAAALLLPLYYIADATITLLRRFIKGEPLMQAHRSHFYQRAMDSGLSVYQIVGRVFMVNIVLVCLATLTLSNQSLAYQLIELAGGCAIVALLLWNFSRVDRF